MLTCLEEKQKSVADRYWPLTSEKTLKISHFEISLVSVTTVSSPFLDVEHEAEVGQEGPAGGRKEKEGRGKKKKREERKDKKDKKEKKEEKKKEKNQEKEEKKEKKKEEKEEKKASKKEERKKRRAGKVFFIIFPSFLVPPLLSCPLPLLIPVEPQSRPRTRTRAHT
jgi:hypothetical protein